MKAVSLEQVDGGYFLDVSEDLGGKRSVHNTLTSAFNEILRLLEERSADGTEESYGRVIIKRTKDLTNEVINSKKATVESVTGPANIEPKVKHEDVIKFEDQGAVGRIKEASKHEKDSN